MEGVEFLQTIVLDVVEAAKAATVKHGPLTTDPVRACSILFREVAEAMDEALQATSPKGSRHPELHMEQMYDELAQVAATAMLQMHDIRLMKGVDR